MLPARAPTDAPTPTSPSPTPTTSLTPTSTPTTTAPGIAAIAPRPDTPPVSETVRADLAP